MVDTPKAFYDLPRARFTWRRPDTGYYIERQAIAIREDELDHWWDLVVGGEGEKAIADGTMAQEIWKIARYMYGNPLLIPMPNRSQNIRTYPLEDDPLLFQEFAGLDPTEEAVIEFANKHGAMFAEPRGWEALLPGNESLHVLKTPPLSRKQLKQDEAPDDIRESIQEFVERRYIKEYGEFDDKKLQQEFVDKWSREGLLELEYFYGKEPSFVIGETLGSWLNEMTSMKYVVELFRFWENKDIDSLKELFTENERDGLRYAYAIENLSVAYTDDELLRRIPPGDVLIPTLLELIRFINNKLRELPVLTKLVMEEDGLKVEPYLVPCNLLSAMWLQFSQHVIGARRSKPCRICGEWVDVTKKREMGKGWERHDKCAANVRATRSNIKKKVTEARRLGEIDDRQVKEIRKELSETNTFEALTAVREKLKAGLEPRKPAAKKPTKKPAAKKTGVAK